MQYAQLKDHKYKYKYMCCVSKLLSIVTVLLTKIHDNGDGPMAENGEKIELLTFFNKFLVQELLRN
jgi:hypothetical protein